MTVRIAQYEFDHATYDAERDVLYLRAGTRREPDVTYATPEGHAVSFDAQGTVVGMTIVNAKWLVDRDGKLRITVPTPIEARAEEVASVLAAASR